jgi:hypothetical protein
MWKFGTLSVSPFPWLEAGYFYYRPSDLTWEVNNKKGHYLDKGFNVKFIYIPKNNILPNIAVGLDDFAGTGYFAREYIVASSNLNNTKLTLGMGWGKFTGEHSFENPFSSVSSKFKIRPSLSEYKKLGGSPTYDQWFRGNASLFGGLEYSLPKMNKLKLKIEYDPFDYLDFSAINRSDANFDIRKKDKNINVGLNIQVNKHLSIETSYIKGNTFNISFNFGFQFDDRLSTKPKFQPNIVKNNKNKKTKLKFYEDLLVNLNNNNLLLQTAGLKENGELNISVQTPDYRNSIRSSSYSAFISNIIAQQNDIDLSIINITHINAGIELNRISYVSSHLDKGNTVPKELKIRHTMLNSGNPRGYLDNEFQPKVNFPVIFSSLSPVLASHIGSPDKFYYGGINLQHVSEIQFKRNLIMSSEVLLPIYSTFDNATARPASIMEHVRTDVLDYLKEDDLQIARLQFDYIFSPRKEVYGKFSGGLFESMFGGIGTEFLYQPFDKKYSLGFEIFRVQQRSSKQRFDFRKYKTTTGHFNIAYRFDNGIEPNLSFGRYLAKDDGYTLDISRRTRSGFKAGIYFTRTNVSAETFGEGSFDKGFYFQIPMDLLSKKYQGNYSNFRLSPLTRDGGAKLYHDKDLRGLIYNSTYDVLDKQWNGFMN